MRDQKRWSVDEQYRKGCPERRDRVPPCGTSGHLEMAPALAFGDVPASCEAAPKPLDPRLGLDTISFDTFGWPLDSDDGESRLWLGDGIALRETFSTAATDYPSLDKLDLLEQTKGPTQTCWVTVTEETARRPGCSRSKSIVVFPS